MTPTQYNEMMLDLLRQIEDEDIRLFLRHLLSRVTILEEG
jgi:hypothetical protein